MPASSIRSAERTRQRVLEAARDYFARKGFDGATMDELSRESGVNKRLVYAHLGRTKREAFEHVRALEMESMISGFGKNVSPDVRVALGGFFDHMGLHQRWVRFLLWDSLSASSGGDGDRKKGRAFWKSKIGNAQKRIRLTSPYAQELVLACVGMAIVPWALPDLAEMITGAKVTSPTFQRRYRDVLNRFAMAATQQKTPRRRAK